ncbi:1-epi-valienol-1,7-bisphosphate-1-adenylyltransferase [Streptomyces cyaneochromogenes]|uniref:1-epi-valienol-1, 7-bisphosphate-1-adenylyltransferase n=1 Tax=Streptomyces cyaneochromogenes TaxID=2496836 RepID=A0A3S9LZJ8_9ACTN|nr:sugar phosphate nucleotidyltransferase [Streptomyces cyaneochromogenes]AZQ32381.1 1-epi-valienol-1,7-bisphosphate-1-adenylyltransferase [Streptomyces cyaneochromogenes]
MDDVRAVLLAGGEGRRLGRLGSGRLKPLVPFGGTSRLVDFSLANARRSGFSEVLLLSQYEERQLMDDLHQVWNCRDFRVHFGPYDTAYRGLPPGELPGGLPERSLPRERGTADALIRKAAHVFGGHPSDVLVLHADHVYRFDYRDMLREHRATRAALTIAYQRVERRYVHLFGMVEFDTGGNLVHFTEKPAEPTSDLVFAAFCIFDAARLRRYLERLDGTDWQHDISRDVIPAMLAGGERIRGHLVRGHWEDIGTVDRYLRAHLALLSAAPTLSLGHLPLTIRPDVARRFIRGTAGVRTAIVPSDLDNAGLVERSVVFPGARIGQDAVVRDSVLLPGAEVPADARVGSAIVLEDGSVQPVDPYYSAEFPPTE